MENEHVTVKLERNSSGQVIKKWQNNHQITSSLGARFDVERNELGNVLQMTASRSEQVNGQPRCSTMNSVKRLKE
ncbi:hypothetical protein, partial [Lysinibacillus sphaericus]|uniref:hypothetical protein n=1 Tax=Lysinibacillus sphaericus TaxID=1421 RepID=UPI001E64332B